MAASAAATIWMTCLLEMTGLLSSNIHRPIGDLIIVSGGFYALYNIVYGDIKFLEKSPVKKQKMDEFFGRLASELNKVIEEHKLNTATAVSPPQPRPPPPTPDDDDELPFHNDEIKKQYEFIKKMSDETDKIAKNLMDITNTSVCSDPTHDARCIRCGADGDDLSECVQGFDYHQIECETCKNRDNSSPKRGRSRTRRIYIHKPESPPRRSRSRDREEDPDCNHEFQRVVRGYDDAYNVCRLCNYETVK